MSIVSLAAFRFSSSAAGILSVIIERTNAMTVGGPIAHARGQSSRHSGVLVTALLILLSQLRLPLALRESCDLR
jgi:hypothetical protein